MKLAQIDKRKTALSLFAVLWLVMWSFLVLSLNIEWLRFSTLAITICLVFFDIRQGRITLRPILQQRSTVLFIIFFTALCLFAIAWLLIDGHSLRTARNWITFFIIGFGAVHYLGWKTFRFAIFGICAGLLVSVPLILLYMYWPEYSIMTPLSSPWDPRMALYMEYCNDLGAMTAWGCCLWFFLRVNKQRILSPGLDWLFLIIMAVPLFLSWYRTSIIAAAAIVIFMAITLPKLSIKKMLFAIVSTALVVIVLHQVPPPGHPQLRRVYSAITSPHTDATIVSRLPLWEVAWHGYLQSPVYGNGLRSYSRLHKETLAKHGAEFRKKYPVVEVDMHRPHNLPLGIMSDMGTIGLILIIGVYAAGLAASGRVSPPFKIGLYALLYSLIIGITDTVMYETWLVLIVFSSCGGAFAGYLRRPEQEFTPGNRSE